ncbi:choice-of-anchor Q domain-containing protein [Litorivivens sp.]|uniref:choice-of-anchor Q domain-containing protein n=1 Tax=Litorivivens sp. TaxID=2020868 RepID=UPI003568834D
MILCTLQKIKMTQGHRAFSMMTLCSLLLLGCGPSDSSDPSEPPNADTQAVEESPSTFVVDSQQDQPDADPGDQICASADGWCTIRAAIMEANASEFGSDGNRYTIHIPAGYYDITLPNPLSTPGTDTESGAERPVITSDETGSFKISVPMTIRGESAASTILDANRLDRVFEIDKNAESTITDVTIRGAAGNSFGGGVYCRATVHLYRVHITDNRAGGGAGIFCNPDGALDLRDSTVSYNIATSQAGGIRIDQWGTIVNSTISYNIAQGLDSPPTGTGIAFLYSEGGGVDVRGFYALIENSTITANQAKSGGAGLHFAKAYLDAAPDPITGAVDNPLLEVVVRNSIIALNVSENGPSDCLAEVAANRIRSEGNNIDSDGSCPFNQPGDLTNIDPMLSPLQDNGGPALSHLPREGSPALAAGDMHSCSTTDQRGVVRASDGDCDIGAIELE